MPNMQEIELFDGHGQMRPLDELAPAIEAMDEATKERFEAVRAAYIEAGDIEEAIKFSSDRVASLVSEISEAENLLRVHYPAQTAHQAVRDFLFTERAKRGIS